MNDNVITTNVAMDEEGYLLDPNEWSPCVAEAIAECEGIKLTHVLRKFSVKSRGRRIKN